MPAAAAAKQTSEAGRKQNKSGKRSASTAFSTANFPLGFSTGQLPVELPADVRAKIPNIGSMRDLQTAEIKNGRAAMMAITGFAVQEFVWGKPVVALTPWFF